MTNFWKAGSLLGIALSLLACAKEDHPGGGEAPKGIDPFSPDAVDSYYGAAQLSVPAGTTTLYVTYKQAGGSVRTDAVPVTPIVAAPSGGKDVEPFGSVKLLLKSDLRSKVSVYYQIPEVEHSTKATGDVRVSRVYALEDFPVEKISFGAFGQTRYVQMPWDFGWMNNESTSWQNTPTYPDDVVFYDEAHDHMLRYQYAYAGSFAGEGYFLEEAYTIQDHVVTGVKYDYCGSCSNCPYCMPWGCSCGCEQKANASFKASGKTGSNSSNVQVDQHGTIIVDYAPKDLTEIKLNEPSQYVTTDQDQTFYHSSGVVMFEDSWPAINNQRVYDTDFDDIVIDYDIEAKLMPDSLLEKDGWREQLKVVLHLRALGSNNSTGPGRVGVKLEGFDQAYVSSVEQHFSLDSWQNPHGELPAFTVTTLQQNSGHYEFDSQNPTVEMAHVFTLNQERAGKGANAEYTYRNGNFTNHTVFNLTYGFKECDKSQYDPALETMSLPYPFSSIMKQKMYNCIPGYINVAGGLFTYTVIYNMKPRKDMTPEESAKARQNMIQAVTNTMAQNFYIITMDWRTIGLKGYDPVFIEDSVHSRQHATFESKLAEGVAAGNVTEENPYGGANGMVWGLKCPTLTRHVWNKLYFSDAYPHYEEWMTSGGTVHSDWYHKDVNPIYLTCEW